jgi:hypothetical protein
MNRREFFREVGLLMGGLFLDMNPDLDEHTLDPLRVLLVVFGLAALFVPRLAWPAVALGAIVSLVVIVRIWKAK